MCRKGFAAQKPRGARCPPRLSSVTSALRNELQVSCGSLNERFPVFPPAPQTPPFHKSKVFRGCGGPFAKGPPKFADLAGASRLPPLSAVGKKSDVETDEIVKIRVSDTLPVLPDGKIGSRLPIKNPSRAARRMKFAVLPLRVKTALGLSVN